MKRSENHRNGFNCYYLFIYFITIFFCRFGKKHLLVARSAVLQLIKDVSIFTQLEEFCWN